MSRTLNLVRDLTRGWVHFSPEEIIPLKSALSVDFGYLCPKWSSPYRMSFTESTAVLVVNFFLWCQVCLFSLIWSLGGWFWGRSQRTRLNEFPAKCPRSQGRAPRQRMAKQSMHPLASSIPTRVNLWKPKKQQVKLELHIIFNIFTYNKNSFSA